MILQPREGRERSAHWLRLAVIALSATSGCFQGSLTQRLPENLEEASHKQSDAEDTNGGSLLSVMRDRFRGDSKEQDSVGRSTLFSNTRNPLRGERNSTKSDSDAASSERSTNSSADRDSLHWASSRSTPAPGAAHNHSAAAKTSGDPARRSALTAASAKGGWVEVLTARGQQQLEYAEDLASRGAVFAARQEALGVLRLVANACDAQHQTHTHVNALSSAMIALEESRDFARAGWNGTSVASVAAGHRTRVLRGSAASRATPVEASQQYCNSAVRDLVIAAGGHEIAAEALHALGRITDVQQGRGLGLDRSSAEQQMIVYYQAAVIVNPDCHRASNELGVLLARLGQWERARTALAQSVAAYSEPQNARNLATVCEHLGDHTTARELRQAVAEAEQTKSNAAPIPAVRWVDQATMARTVGMPIDHPAEPATR